MKRHLANAVKVLCLILPLGTTGLMAMQEETERPFTYGTYYKCAPESFASVDKVVVDELAAVYDKAVSDGVITNWGWAAHHTGGEWSRLLTYASGSLDGLMSAYDELNTRVADAGVDPDNVLGKSCPSHDDYIWQRNLMVGGPDNMGTAALSSYYVCDVNQQMYANEVFAEYIAPAFDAQIKENGLTGYSLWDHIYGGKYRKIMVLNAKSMSDLVRGHGAAMQTLAAERENDEKAQMFSKICSSHTDYLWNWLPRD